MFQIYVKSHTTFYDRHGNLVDEYPKIMANYKKNGGFKLDIYQVIPFEILAGGLEIVKPGKGLTVMSIMRVLGKMPRIRYIFLYFMEWNSRLDAK